VVLLVLAPTIWQQSEDVLEFGHAPNPWLIVSPNLTVPPDPASKKLHYADRPQFMVRIFGKGA
jgi:hypothetical protein